MKITNNPNGKEYRMRSINNNVTPEVPTRPASTPRNLKRSFLVAGLALLAVLVLSACGESPSDNVNITRAPETTTTEAPEADDVEETVVPEVTTTTEAPEPESDIPSEDDLIRVAGFDGRDWMSLNAVELTERQASACTLTALDHAEDIASYPMMTAFFGISEIYVEVTDVVFTSPTEASVFGRVTNQDGLDLETLFADLETEEDPTPGAQYIVEDGEWKYLDDDCMAEGTST